MPPGLPESPEGPKVPLISTDAAPNPFNPQTTIHYAVARAGAVSLNVFDAAGRRVRTLVDREYAVANEAYAVSWNGRDDSGGRLASGVYYYVLDAEGGQERRKLLLLK